MNYVHLFLYSLYINDFHYVNKYFNDLRYHYINITFNIE